jgi:hypothetical protein
MYDICVLITWDSLMLSLLAPRLGTDRGGRGNWGVHAGNVSSSDGEVGRWQAMLCLARWCLDVFAFDDVAGCDGRLDVCVRAALGMQVLVGWERLAEMMECWRVEVEGERGLRRGVNHRETGKVLEV